MTKLEEIAWAISGQDGGELDPRWIRKTVAGLKAMREPSEGMIQAAAMMPVGPAAPGSNPPAIPILGPHFAALAWGYMIDALLSESPG